VRRLVVFGRWALGAPNLAPGPWPRVCRIRGREALAGSLVPPFRWTCRGVCLT